MSADAPSSSPAPGPAVAPVVLGGGAPGPGQAEVQLLPPSEHSQTTWTSSYRLSPSVEEGIKAAVAATTPPKPRWTYKRVWTLLKYLLRWASLAFCAAIIIVEMFASIFDGGYFGTIFGMIWAVLIGAWDIWRMTRLRKQRGTEVVGMWHLSGEGAILFVGLVAVIGLAWALTARVRINTSTATRLIFLVVIVVITMGAHAILFFRAITEHKRGADYHEDIELSPASATILPQQPQQQQQQPARIIVQYVQVCPNCGNHTEPMSGERMDALAQRGEAQPQSIPLADLRQFAAPRGA